MLDAPLARADAARRLLVPTARPTEPETLPLFPDESGGGFPLSPEESLRLNRALARLHRDLIEACAIRLEGHSRIPAPAARTLAREALIRPTHFFMDRLLRLEKAVRGQPRSSLAVADGEPLEFPDTPEEFSRLVCSSEAFNQGMLRLLAGIRGLPTAPSPPPAPAPPAPSPRPVVNNNFTDFSGSSLARKIRRRLALHSSRLWGRVPLLSMAYAAPLLREAWLCGPGRFAELDYLSRPLERRGQDPELRRKLIVPALKAVEASLLACLESCGLDDPNLRNAAASVFQDYLQRAYPAILLEAIPPNLDRSLAVLRPYAPRPLVFSGVGISPAVYMVAAARALGMETIGCQHGLHYGYTDDLTVIIDLEYAHCDRFVTWGWTRLPDHPVCADIKTVPLPSPWLSWRRRQLAPAAGSGRGREEFDVLLATDKVQRFPPTSAGAGIARNDSFAAMAKTLKGLVGSLTRRGLSVLHKPFDGSYTRVFERTLAQLDSTSGGLYRRVDRFDKGLTPSLLERCRVVVWDQPSTGFAECLVSGMPTLVLWTRDYFKESTRAEPIFAELEAAGIMHRDPARLSEEVARLRQAPEAWLARPEHAAAAARFCREYARTDDDWRRSWKAFLDGLA